MNRDDLIAEGARTERARIIAAITQIISSYAPISSLDSHVRNIAAKYVVPELEQLRNALETTDDRKPGDIRSTDAGG